MSIIIKSKKINLTPAIKNYINKKIEKFNTFFEAREIKKIEVLLEEKKYKDKTNIFKAQLTLWLLGNTILRAEEKEATPNAAIDFVMEKIEHQISRYKGRFQARFRKSRKKLIPNIISSDIEIEPQINSLADLTELKRSKKFKVTPMFIGDAIEQMNFLDHNFFVFMNKDTNKLSIVYKRNSPDEEYGLLEPEL